MAAAVILAACATSNTALDKQTFTLCELNGTEYVPVEAGFGTISFADGRCNAYLGGNQIFAVYTEGKNGKLEFSQSGSTKMFVPDELREDEFVEAFGKVVSYRMDGGTVSFLDASKNVLFRAVK